MEELIYVVGTAFINDGKLLISMLKKQQEENVKKKLEKDLIS